MNSNFTCRQHDREKKNIDAAFFPIYSIMFVLSVLLNSILLHLTIKRNKFLLEKRLFDKLFPVLIFLDLIISILILPNILIKKYSNNEDTFIILDGYVAVRDYSISSQMIILVVIAIDRLLTFLLPLSNYKRTDKFMKIFIIIIIVTGLFYLTRLILLSVNLTCNHKRFIDKYAKLFIGITGGVLMTMNLLIYIVLFGLLCHHQIDQKRKSYLSIKSIKSIRLQETINEPDIIQQNSITKRNSLSNKNKLKINQKIGSIKFARVLFAVNLLMIISYLPAILYNGNVIGFPTYSVYYLFFLHSLGDPILFFMTRQELKCALLKFLRIK